ncbi:MAG: hypothetical protein A2277_03100 [Desulfobacterales bacterium RIFOXYA12_FULL_46_15]|nr:MAG: hypothetical protein A2277_03100 [Desulfobacterales bacterium RIFOXYA12_FULL_46_15]
MDDKNRLMIKRMTLGRLCLIASFIVMISVLDALTAACRKPANDLDIITGLSFRITGNVYGNVKSVLDIGVVSDSPELTLDFDKDIFSGYFLGVDMWRAQLKAGSSLKPGKYHLKLIPPDLPDIKPGDRLKLDALLSYTVNVYGDMNSLRQASLSFINRYTRVSPWFFAIGFFLIALWAGIWIFVISGKIDAEMAKQGFAEIYRVSKKQGGFEVFFGLGRLHGLEAGEKIGLFDASGDFLKEIAVDTIGKEDSSVVVDILKIRPGFMVARMNR